MTTPYHLQANGLDERYNQTLVNALAKFAQDHRHTYTWDLRIGELVYAYNTAVHESSKHTPFEVMFGRMAKLQLTQSCVDTSETDRQARRQTMEEAVKSNIEAAQVQIYNDKFTM